MAHAKDFFYDFSYFRIALLSGEFLRSRACGRHLWSDREKMNAGSETRMDWLVRIGKALGAE
jgi:hypothetical protein